MSRLVKFLPSFVGSKAYWVEKLRHIAGNYLVELFAGSAVISANLAGRALINDLDPYIYLIFSNFDKLIVPDVFTMEDYFNVRSKPDWWKCAFCLQKMSFSGVFRYSKNGYNVPIKSGVKEIRVRPEYELAVKRFKELAPIVTNSSYEKVDIPDIKEAIVIFDPPYRGSKAAYNTGCFDYSFYWSVVKNIESRAKGIIVFDSVANMPYPKGTGGTNYAYFRYFWPFWYTVSCPTND